MIDGQPVPGVGGDLPVDASASVEFESMRQSILQNPTSEELAELQIQAVESGEVSVVTQECAPEDSAKNLAGMLEIFAMVADETGYKKTAELWNDETRLKVSERAIPVLQKSAFGRKIIDFINSGMGLEEMALAVVLLPLLRATREAMKSDIANMQAQAMPAQAMPDQSAD